MEQMSCLLEKYKSEPIMEYLNRTQLYKSEPDIEHLSAH